MELSHFDLTQFINAIAATIDEGNHPDISIDTIISRIRSKDLANFLDAQLGNGKAYQKISSFMSTQYGNELIAKMNKHLDECNGDVDRKWNLKNNGLCLLITLTVAIILDSMSDSLKTL